MEHGAIDRYYWMVFHQKLPYIPYYS